MNKMITDTTSRRPCVIKLLFVLFVVTNLATAQTRPAQGQGHAMTRNEEIGKLLAVLRDPDLKQNRPDQVTSAIRRLGDMRAVEAIDDLIELLTFASKSPAEELDPNGQIIVEFQMNHYPATGALFQIGRSALPALSKVIELNGLDSLKGRNALSTVQDIFRDDLTEGVKYLEINAKESANPDLGQHLAQAAAQLRKLEAQVAKTKK
jgi:hypothetical protein